MSVKRKPAQKVRCPHCNWIGSARGLFSHSRLAHPKLVPPKTSGTRVSTTINPYAVTDTKTPISKAIEALEIAKEDRLRTNKFFDILETWLYEQLPDSEKDTYQLKTNLPAEISSKAKKFKFDDILLLMNATRNPEVRKLIFQSEGNKLNRDPK